MIKRRTEAAPEEEEDMNRKRHRAACGLRKVDVVHYGEREMEQQQQAAMEQQIALERQELQSRAKKQKHRQEQQLNRKHF